jgi:hypothetical protein
MAVATSSTVRFRTGRGGATNTDMLSAAPSHGFALARSRFFVDMHYE